MILSVFLIIVGFALLILGADWLVNGASSIAKRFQIPEIIIGLTIVSIGTSIQSTCLRVVVTLGHWPVKESTMCG